MPVCGYRHPSFVCGDFDSSPPINIWKKPMSVQVSRCFCSFAFFQRDLVPFNSFRKPLQALLLYTGGQGILPSKRPGSPRRVAISETARKPKPVFDFHASPSWSTQAVVWFYLSFLSWKAMQNIAIIPIRRIWPLTLVASNTLFNQLIKLGGEPWKY